MHTTTLDYNSYRNKLGITIIVSNLLIFPLIFLAYLLKGFIYEEMMELFKFFLPLKLIYLAAVVKFVIQYQKKGEETRPVTDLKLPYEKVSRIFVYSHVTSIAVLIILSAFNMGISFTELTDLLVFVESLFGVCIGYFITDMFGTKE